MKRKKILILTLSIIIIAGGGITAYAVNQKHAFNDYITQAKELINKGEYSTAENLLKKAESIDNTKEVSNLLKETKSLETQKKFNKYIIKTKELIKSGKYDAAKKTLEIAKSIDSANTEITDLSNTIIKYQKEEDAKKINEYINLGNEAVRNLKMTDAFNYFSKVLKIDPDNTSAISGINEGIYDYYNEMINEDVDSNNFDDAYNNLTKISELIKKRYNLYNELNKAGLSSPEKDIDTLKHPVDIAKKKYEESKSFSQEKAQDILNAYLKQTDKLKDKFFTEFIGTFEQGDVNNPNDELSKKILNQTNYRFRLLYDVYMDESKTAAMTHTVGWYLVTPDAIYSESFDLSTITKLSDIKK